MPRARPRKPSASARPDPLVVGVGERVVLRHAREKDRAEFLKLRRASRRFLRPWEPRVTDPTGNGLFDRLLAGRRAADARRFLVCRREDGAILGAFNISNIEFWNNNVRIYNRWGQVVKEFRNYRNTWNGSDVSDGTYFYEVVLGDGRAFTGHLTVLR